jgi:hypothetical protein
MAEVGPSLFPVLLHGIATFGIGGLLGGLAASLRSRGSGRLVESRVSGS